MERLCKILIVSTTLFFLMVFICSCAQTETIPNAEQSENPLETTTSTTATETEIPVETTPNNWYVEGYVVPDNWIAVMTWEETFEHYDELTGETQEGKTVEEIVETLVNRNILVFEIFHANGWECKNNNSKI